MIRQYLLNKNESVAVSFFQKRIRTKQGLNACFRSWWIRTYMDLDATIYHILIQNQYICEYCRILMQ